MPKNKKEQEKNFYLELNENKYEIEQEVLSENVRLHFHDYLEAELVLDGEAIQYINDYKVKIKRGSFSLLRPNIDCHSLEIEYLNVFKFYVKPFILEDELWKGVSILSDPLVIELEGEELEHTINLFKVLQYEQAKTEKYSDGIIKNTINSLLYLYFQSKIGQDNNIIVKKDIINYLLENDKYLTDVSLQDFANNFGYSFSHASKYFKMNTGMSFSEAKQFFRIQNAKRLLLSTNYSINEISNMCGFNYYHLFHKLFKKSTGMTPFEFKKSNR